MPTTNAFGEAIKARRAELRLTLREFAKRSNMDPGNASKIERGRLAPPQREEVLARVAHALELEAGSAEWQNLLDLAAAANGRVPTDILSDEEAMARLPVLFRTVRNKSFDPEKLDKLLQSIRKA